MSGCPCRPCQLAGGHVGEHFALGSDFTTDQWAKAARDNGIADAEIARAIACVEEVERQTRTLVIHRSAERWAYLARQGGMKVIVSDDIEPGKAYIIASPAEIAEQLEANDGKLW